MVSLCANLDKPYSIFFIYINNYLLHIKHCVLPIFLCEMLKKCNHNYLYIFYKHLIVAFLFSKQFLRPLKSAETPLQHRQLCQHTQSTSARKIQPTDYPTSRIASRSLLPGTNLSHSLQQWACHAFPRKLAGRAQRWLLREDHRFPAAHRYHVLGVDHRHVPVRSIHVEETGTHA